MPVVRLKGLNQVSKKLRDGSTATYWYAWKGGPRLPGKPGSAEFIAAYNEAVAERKAPRNDTLAGLVTLYRASPEWLGQAESTKKQWIRWLDRICRDEDDLDIGGLTYTLLEDRRVRKDILEWRDQWAATPRTADYAMQVLSRVLSFGVDRGMLAVNVAAGVKSLYDNDRADKVWTSEEIDRFAAAAKSPEVAFIVRLACLTGLRREDLVGLQWDQVGAVAIVRPTRKSKGKRVARVPLLTETKQLLAEIKAQQAKRRAELCEKAIKKGRSAPPPIRHVLTNTRGKHWSVDGLEHQVVDTKQAAGIDKHLHDARGTFATRLRKAGLTAGEIADILGWEEDRVSRLLATYVDLDHVVSEIAERIARNEKAQEIPNQRPTRSRGSTLDRAKVLK